MFQNLVNRGIISSARQLGTRLLDRLWHANDPRPNLMQPPKPLFFVHVQKTAGTSFSNYLASHWNRAGTVQPIIGGMENMRPDPKVNLYYGHVDFSAIENPDQYFLITFLRDPIERCVSQYKSWNNPKNFKETDPWRKIMNKDQIDQVLLAQKLSLSEFILCGNPAFDAHLTNLQSRMLCDRKDGVHDYPSSIDNVLSRFHFVGIVERFDWSIDKFKAVFRGTLPYRLPAERENRSTQGNLVMSPKARQRLMDMNEHDINLYDAACRHFLGDKSPRQAA